VRWPFANSRPLMMLGLYVVKDPSGKMHSSETDAPRTFSCEGFFEYRQLQQGIAMTDEGGFTCVKVLC
jgi:hypothetical protein